MREKSESRGMTQRCDFRDLQECACQGECLAQPRPLPPHHSFPLRYQLSACVVFGAIAAFFFYVSVPNAMQESKKQFLAEQEVRHVAR